MIYGLVYIIYHTYYINLYTATGALIAGCGL